MNATVDFTMDTRTPPKIKLQHRNMERKKQEIIENSHPGIAVPVDVDTFLETSTQKRPIIYRNENKTPTTDSGISTWILLSGQSTTSKPVRKQPTIKTTPQPAVNKATTTTTEKPVKSTIKMKPVTTRKPPKTTTSAPVTTTTKTEEVKATEKNQQINNNKILTKIKASVLNNAVKNKTSSVTTIAPQTTISVVTTTTVENKKTAEKVNDTPVIGEISENTESNDLQAEAKDGSIDLPNEKQSTTTKRPRRPANNNNNKKKKNNGNNNKNRRRKPAAEKNANVSNSTKIAQKQKPFGTQIYNYLSREVMPTVGVGLVGLVVTAGLASYFLYPFGGLRRAYDSALDRKDYHYDEYAAGGMAEEELIGKVIAGMPEQTIYPNSYRTSLARKEAYRNEVNYNYRNSDPYYNQYPHRDYQTVSVGSKIGYGRDVVAEHQKETGYTVDDGEMKKPQFVVGNVPKEFEQPITPVAVPEHGPRSLRVRRRAQNVEENEVINYETKSPPAYINKIKLQPVLNKQPNDQTDSTYIKSRPAPASDSSVSSEDKTEEASTTETPELPEERPTFFSFVRNLLEIKVRLGLDFLLKTTDKFSGYLRGVQQRVNNVFREQKSRVP